MFFFLILNISLEVTIVTVILAQSVGHFKRLNSTFAYLACAPIRLPFFLIFLSSISLRQWIRNRKQYIKNVGKLIAILFQKRTKIFYKIESLSFHQKTTANHLPTIMKKKGKSMTVAHPILIDYSRKLSTVKLNCKHVLKGILRLICETVLIARLSPDQLCLLAS